MSEADVTSDTSFSSFTEGNALNCSANWANVAAMFPAVRVRTGWLEAYGSFHIDLP